MTDQQTDESEFRPFNLDTDLAAIKRMWREVGWVSADEEKYVDHFFAVGETLLATLNGEPECCVHITDGTLRLQQTDIPLCAVTAVITSRIARNHAFAKRLTALQLQHAAGQGAAVAALGMFDQGFYDLLGFGTAGYDHHFAFDPADLRVNAAVPTPRRLDANDFALMHGAMCARAKVHGSVVLHPAELMRAEFGWSENGFGLGYGQGDKLTHFVWLRGSVEHGPYAVTHMAYQNAEQLLELLGLLKSLADQVYSVRMIEPPEIQLQSLLSRPFRSQALTKDSKHQAEHRSFAWWQLRMLDVSACVTAYSADNQVVSFQLELSDPLSDLLPEKDSWRGVSGQYKVEIARLSSAVPGEDMALPRLSCSVNAFTRLMWGVAKASSLVITDDFAAPEGLISALDRALHLPTPHTGWEF